MATPSVADPDLYALAERVGQALQAMRGRIVTAESCTAGWISKALTDVPGSSRWFECAYVTYSNAAKIRDLGVSEQTLAEHGAVSAATVREMAEGALARSGAEIAVAVSGIAGPEGGTPEKPVGTVWLAVAMRNRPERLYERCGFEGDRDAVRRQTVAHALRRTLELLQAHAAAAGPDCA